MQSDRRPLLVLIVLACVAGLWLRTRASTNVTLDANVDHVLSHAAALKIEGEFQDALAGLTGYEILSAQCAQPVGALPTPVETSAIPQAYRYRTGNYEVRYFYAGSVYPEAAISYRLKLLGLFNRARALLHNSQRLNGLVYVKVWVPAACADRADDISLWLGRAMTAPQND